MSLKQDFLNLCALIQSIADTEVELSVPTGTATYALEVAIESLEENFPDEVSILADLRESHAKIESALGEYA